MEVKPGYQRTEFGVAPVDWCLRRISEIGEVRGRVGWKGYTKKDLVSYGPLTIGAKHIDRQGRLDLSDPTYLSLPKFLESPEIKVQLGDILIVQRGTIGKLVLIQTHIGDATINPSMVILRLKNASPSYVRYFLLSEVGQRQIVADTSSTGVPMISQRQIQGFTVVMPPTEREQRDIAAALSDVDALLGGLDRLIAKKRDLKQAAMQQLLTGHTRLPGFFGEWEVKRLGDVAEMGSGGTPLSSVAEYYDGDIPWVSISDMTKGGKVITKTERNLTALGFENSAAQMFPAGTVLYAMYASLGECSIAGLPVCTSQAILGIRPHRELDGEFLYYFLTSLKPRVKTLGQQGTQSNLNKGMVQEFQLALPSPPEQTTIAAVLSDMDAELAALEARGDKTRALKHAMMQELLTGKTRLVPTGSTDA